MLTESQIFLYGCLPGGMGLEAPVMEAPVVDAQLVQELKHGAHASEGQLHFIQFRILPWPHLHGTEQQLWHGYQQCIKASSPKEQMMLTAQLENVAEGLIMTSLHHENIFFILKFCIVEHAQHSHAATHLRG